MEILIDESGSFANKNAKKNSWCNVSAYACPESEKRKYQIILNNLKLKQNISVFKEIKLCEIQEENYFKFLEDLSNLQGNLFSVATDSGMNTIEIVTKHQQEQALSILENKEKMLYEEGKYSIQLLADEMILLAQQQYIQLFCQIFLINNFIINGISYFVQFIPNSLKSFRWRIDQKDLKKVNFEYVFEKFCPCLLQTFSIENPVPYLDWCDYRPMKKYIYDEGRILKYLTNEIKSLKNKGAFNIQKIVREDIKFIDSKTYLGIQVVDLLSSGLRRLLKKDFKDNEKAAIYLGKLMLKNKKTGSPIKFVLFNERDYIDRDVENLVKIMYKNAKSMIYK